MSVRFSVIVPVHNGEKYIDELMDSILPQLSEEETPAEVVLVENGSDDVSPAICDRYAEENEAVRVLHFDKIGAYAARREGMKAAEGDYLIFADADDVVSDKLLEELAGFIDFLKEKSGKPDVVLYNTAACDNRDKRMFAFPFEENRLYRDKSVFYELMQKNDSLNALWNKAISSALADRILEDEEDKAIGKKIFNHGEDLLQTAEILDKAEGIAYLDSILYYYRENTGGLTGTYHSEFWDNQVYAWEAFDKYAEKWSGDGCKQLINERKTLTCCILAGKLIYSKLGGADKKALLKDMMETEFYREYAAGNLPDWAPEESVFVHNLITSDNPLKSLLKSGRKYCFRQFVKGLLRRK